MTRSLLATFGLFVGISYGTAVESDFVTVPVDDEEDRFPSVDTPEGCDCYNIEMTLKEELEDRTCYSYLITKDRTMAVCKPLRLRNFIMNKDCAIETDDILAFTPDDMTVIAEPLREPIPGIRVNVLEVETNDDGTEFYTNADRGPEQDVEFRMCFKPWMIDGEQESSQIAYNMRGDPTKAATCDVGAIFPSFCKTEIKVLAKEEVCMDSTQYSEEWEFNAPLNGVINGVELIYKSGDVSCNNGATDAESKWGCYRNLFLLNFLKVEDTGNVLLYPSPNMEDLDEDGEFGLTSSCSNGCTVHKFTMETATPYDDVLKMSDPSSAYIVTKEDVFSVQYSEGCCGTYDSDNVGTVCFDVWFYYEEIGCQDVEEEVLPLEPTVKPSLAPTYTVCDSNDALNIAFLLDESGSIDEDEWEVVKTFVNRLINFDIGPESYVGLFEYATETAYENFANWTKNDDVGKQELTKAIERNKWNVAGQTYTWWGTSKVLDAFWSYKNSCRDESCTRNDLLFLVTDGVPSDSVCPDMEARIAGSNIDVVLVIVGGTDDPDAIEAAIGCLDKDGTDILKIDSVDSDEFNAIEMAIRAKTCSGLYPAGPETDAGEQYQYCPPDDPVAACTYDLGVGTNVGTGGQGGVLDPTA